MQHCMAQEEDVQQYNWPATLAFLGGLAVLFLWRRLRRRKRLEKMVREAQRRSEARRKGEKAGKRKRVKPRPTGRKAARRGKKERERASMLSQLVRFAVFQFLKKLISQQINRIELDLQKSPLGARLTASTGAGKASA